MPPAEFFLAPALGYGQDTAYSVAAEFQSMALLAGGRVEKVTRRYTDRLTTQVKANASGRPGPNAPTGDYRRDISGRVRWEGNEVVGYVGTNKPQGWRLERGYVGPDSLGRVFVFRPYPHFGPAWDEVTPGYVPAVAYAVIPGGSARG